MADGHDIRIHVAYASPRQTFMLDLVMKEGATVVSIVVILVLVYLLMNLLVDLLYAALDPRIRYE